MVWLIWGGAALTVLGLGGILYSVFLVTKARRAELSDDDLRARLNKVLPVNIGALFMAMLGLMMVIVGVILA